MVDYSFFSYSGNDGNSIYSSNWVKTSKGLAHDIIEIECPGYSKDEISLTHSSGHLIFLAKKKDTHRQFNIDLKGKKPEGISTLLSRGILSIFIPTEEPIVIPIFEEKVSTPRKSD